MSIANKDTFFASASGTKTVSTRPGRICGFIATTAEATSQSFTLYDGVSSSSAVLLTYTCYIGGLTFPVFFPDDKPLYFDDGLTINPGNCDVLLFIAS